MRGREALIVYGNCQAAAIAAILAKSSLRKRFRILFSSDFDAPGQQRTPLRERDVNNCALFWRQEGTPEFPYQTRLPEGLLTLTFPAIDLNLLWPCTVPNPYNEPAPPRNPWGPFPYGNSVIFGCIARGMQPQATLDYYLNAWDEHKLNMTHLEQIERDRLADRDSRCDVKMSAWIFESFRSRELFWTVNHPAPPSLQRLVEQLLVASAAIPQNAVPDIADTLRRHFPRRGPLGAAVIPLHPRAAGELRLEWYDPNRQYEVFGTLYHSSVDYFRAFIEYCYRKNQERPAAGA